MLKLKMKMINRLIVIFIFMFIVIPLGLLSCGLDAFYFIDNIPVGQRFDVGRATIQLPDSSRQGYSEYFSNFLIFYRIYITENFPVNIINTVDDRNLINPKLNSDWLTLFNYTWEYTEGIPPSNLEREFYNRMRYVKLELEDVNIDSILGRDSLNNILEIEFPDFELPRLTLRNRDGSNERSYNLSRANQRMVGTSFQTFYPLPENSRHFLNYPELYDIENIKDDINADVENMTASNRNPPYEYTYVSMYIFTKGVSHESPPTDIFSQATFLSIFKIPNQF